MPFDHILGHETLIQGLKTAHANERAAHAYIFSGPQGIGKTLVAEAFIQLLACKSHREDGDACGVCRTCRLISEERHPDLFILRPEGQFIKINQVRDITKRLIYAPVESATRGIIIHNAETLHPAAANALLKTLEEPSANNVFVLLTDRPNLLLTTIRSRCQQIRFPRLTRGTVTQWLIDNAEQSPEVAAEISAMSAGSIGAALEMTDADLTNLRHEWLLKLGQFNQLSNSEVLNLADELSRDKQALPLVLDILRCGLRDTLLIACQANEDHLTFRDRTQSLPRLSTDKAMKAIGAIDDTEIALRGNVNARLCSENLLLSLKQLMVTQ